MAYVNLNFVPGEILTAAKMNLLAANDASFHDGTGISDGSIHPQHINSTVALTEQDVIKEVVPIGYGLRASVVRAGSTVFLTVNGVTALPTNQASLSETIPSKFCPAAFLGTVNLKLTALNSNKTGGYALFKITTGGNLSCVASSGHNEWYGTAAWITDKPAN